MGGWIENPNSIIFGLTCVEEPLITKRKDIKAPLRVKFEGYNKTTDADSIAVDEHTKNLKSLLINPNKPPT